MSHDERVPKLIFEMHRLEEKIDALKFCISYNQLAMWAEHGKTHQEIEKELLALRRRIEEIVEAHNLH